MHIVGLLLVLLLPSFAPAAENHPPAFSPERLVGEALSYDIAFLWFDRLAQGELSFTAGDRPGSYRAALEAKTLGVASWLTGDRVQRYVSLMEAGSDGQLRSLVYESSILKGKGKSRQERIKRYEFDYQKGEIRYQRIRDGKTGRTESLPLEPTAPPNDILTAFYNFRSGVFGPLKAGERYVIPAFSREGASDIIVETIAEAQRKDYPFFPRHGLLARVTVDQEVFDTGEGHVYVWFDDQGRPARGIVEDIIGLGSVRGYLQQPGPEPGR